MKKQNCPMYDDGRDMCWRKNGEADHSCPGKCDTAPRVLRLTLKRKWFLMILQGLKAEEYREIKHYWIVRLIRRWNGSYKTASGTIHRGIADVEFRHFDYIEFRNGYASDAPTMLVECKGISFGTGRPAWGGDGVEKFVISLGEIVSTYNTEKLVA